MISKPEAIKLAKNTSRFSHALIASAMMKKTAERLGESSLEWELVGLLHDLDIDETRNNMNKHGIIASEALKGKLPEHCLYAIKAHDHRTGFKPESKLDKALIAVDSATVLLERVRKQLKKLDVEAIKEQMEIVALKQPWHKGNILKCREIGLSLEEFLLICLGSFEGN
ncbi:hypothetical protein KAT42_02180 [Candidatus Bathyarchaeota archaeon]|nr:hypothetical protein [Candidatus Bathyarchaeota archaeon]